MKNSKVALYKEMLNFVPTQVRELTDKVYIAGMTIDSVMAQPDVDPKTAKRCFEIARIVLDSDFASMISDGHGNPSAETFPKNGIVFYGNENLFKEDSREIRQIGNTICSVDQRVFPHTDLETIGIKSRLLMNAGIFTVNDLMTADIKSMAFTLDFEEIQRPLKCRWTFNDLGKIIDLRVAIERLVDKYPNGTPDVYREPYSQYKEYLLEFASNHTVEGESPMSYSEWLTRDDPKAREYRNSPQSIMTWKISDVCDDQNTVRQLSNFATVGEFMRSVCNDGQPENNRVVLLYHAIRDVVNIFTELGDNFDSEYDVNIFPRKVQQVLVCNHIFSFEELENIADETLSNLRRPCSGGEPFTGLYTRTVAKVASLYLRRMARKE